MEERFCDRNHYKVAQLINSGRRMNITNISRETGFTISHLSIVFSQWFECGIIIKEEKIKGEGKETYIKLTEFGSKVSFPAFEAFMNACDIAKKKREEFFNGGN